MPWSILPCFLFIAAAELCPRSLYKQLSLLPLMHVYSGSNRLLAEHVSRPPARRSVLGEAAAAPSWTGASLLICALIGQPNTERAPRWLRPTRARLMTLGGFVGRLAVEEDLSQGLVADLEQSCSSLGAMMASWTMMRGSMSGRDPSHINVTAECKLEHFQKRLVSRRRKGEPPQWIIHTWSSPTAPTRVAVPRCISSMPSPCIG